MTQRVDKDSLPLDKPRRTPNHPTKSHIVKTKVDGKEKIIRFGEQGASTAGKPKANESDRMKAKRASFKARHAANIAKGKSSAAYWADRVKWAEGGAVRNRRTRGTPALDLIEQMRRSGQRNEAEFDVARLARTRRQDRLPVPPIPPRPPAAPGVLESVPTPVATPQNFPGETTNDATPTRNVTYDGNNPLVIAAANAAQRYNIPIPLFLAQIQQESRFDPNARSRVGAFGLGQLMPATARELGVDPRDPIQNLDGAARYMRQMLDRFGEVPLALAAYNAGPGRVRRAGNTIPNIPETQNYVSTIMRNAGIPGYAEGGLAELDRRYAEGGAVMAGPMAYDPNQIEALAREVEGGTEPQGYAEGGEVSSPAYDEYERSFINRMRGYARGGKVEAGIEGMYRRYYEGGGVGGDPADNDTSSSTAEGQAAAGGVSGAGAGPTGAGAGSPADAGPGPDTGPSGVGGGMSMADPEGTNVAANMNTAAQAAAMGYGYDPTTGFAGTGMAPTGFHADPGALGAISGMLSGTISPTQALGYAMQSAIPGATIGTQIDEFGNPSRAANVDFGQMIGTLGGTMAGLATGFGPGAGRVGGMVGSALGQALGYEPGVVGYSPGVYGGPATPDTSSDDYLNYGYNYGYAPVNQAMPMPVNAPMPVNVFGRRVNV